MDRELAIKRLNKMRRVCDMEECNINCERCEEALDLAIEALGQTEIVRCKDCKHYNPPHIEYNDGTRKDYPDGLVTVDIGMNVGGKCENSTTTMRTYCTAHDRENPDDFEELMIFREPMEYCSFGEKAEKHQLSGETSTISEKESVEGDAESATTTDCISRQAAIEAFCDDCRGLKPGQCEHWDSCKSQKELRSLPPVTPTERTGEWENIWVNPDEENSLMFRCSECGKISVGRHNFCPNCGARMKGGDDE